MYTRLVFSILFLSTLFYFILKLLVVSFWGEWAGEHGRISFIGALIPPGFTPMT